MPEKKANQKKTKATNSRKKPAAAPESADTMSELRIGPIIGVLVILLVLILGGLYLWGAILNENRTNSANNTPRAVENNEPETPRSTADAQILETVSSSDTLNAIEADLETTNLQPIETSIDTLKREFEAALEAN